MKGMVFTEFLQMVEDVFSANMVDDIIDETNPASGGAYTNVGTYDHQEIVNMVVALSQHTGIGVNDLIRSFGQHLFVRFVAGYPVFFEGITHAFDFLSGIENIIHAEVRKLYPDAELPRFETEHHDAKKLVLLYKSSRHFEDLAEGLILGCIAHFGQNISIQRETVGDGEFRYERFSLTLLD